MTGRSRSRRAHAARRCGRKAESRREGSPSRRGKAPPLARFAGWGGSEAAAPSRIRRGAHRGDARRWRRAWRGSVGAVEAHPPRARGSRCGPEIAIAPSEAWWASEELLPRHWRQLESEGCPDGPPLCAFEHHARINENQSCFPVHKHVCVSVCVPLFRRAVRSFNRLFPGPLGVSD